MADLQISLVWPNMFAMCVKPAVASGWNIHFLPFGPSTSLTMYTYSFPACRHFYLSTSHIFCHPTLLQPATIHLQEQFLIESLFAAMSWLGFWCGHMGKEVNLQKGLPSFRDSATWEDQFQIVAKQACMAFWNILKSMVSLSWAIQSKWLKLLSSIWPSSSPMAAS